MEKILRQCYKERGIVGVNFTVFQKRIAAIERLLEGEILDETEWKALTNWMIGIESKDVEDILIKLEENFCQEDFDFSKDKNIKELQILAGVLIYKYSKNEGNYCLPMMVICEYHMENAVVCEYLYQLFMQYINEMRLSMRHSEDVKQGNYIIGIQQFKKSIADQKKKMEEDGTDFSYSDTEIETVINLLEKCESNFNHMLQMNKYLIDELKVQKEEANIAWWLLNEWSQCYDCSFSKLKIEEVVLAVSVELHNLSQYILGPYAVRQVIYRGISRWKKRTSSISLENFVNAVRDKIIELKVIDVERMKPEQVQPIIMALKCIYECRESTDEHAWKAIFEGCSKRKAADLKMSVEEFAYQLYLELELANIQLEVDD